MAEIAERLGCSTICFQHLSLEPALAAIVGLGFAEIDLGALPGVCDHVPFELEGAAIQAVAGWVRASGLSVRSVNGDIGDLNDPEADRSRQDVHLDRLLCLTRATGAHALVLPCGSLGQAPIRSLDEDLDLVAARLSDAASAAAAYNVEIWVESLHFLRLCWNRTRADALHARLVGNGVRVVLDVAHAAAAGHHLSELIDSWGTDIAHVHLRDAALGDFNRSLGEGSIDFGAVFDALEAISYTGSYTLELPSRAYVADATSEQGGEFGALRVDAVRKAAACVTIALRNSTSETMGARS